MADPEHLNILAKGVSEWNKWRKDNPKITPKFQFAHLSIAKLKEINLRGADLHEAMLNGADLRGADLTGADLTFAVLRDANLRIANLSETNLSGADLSGVDLTGANLNLADLVGADLNGANLDGANLSGARILGGTLNMTNLRGTNLCYIHIKGTELDRTDFKDCSMGYTTLNLLNLSSVKGLETVNHHGPSSIGIDTIFMSGGNIPEVFLRDCGVPQEFIDYIPSFTDKPWEYYSCFISYAEKELDSEFARRLHADLVANEVRTWFAPHDMKTGQEIRQTIDDAIKLRDKVVLVLSMNSINSNWVKKEVETAFEEECRRGKIVLFPIRIDDAVMKTDVAWAADIRRSRHIGDFRNWKSHDEYQNAFNRLLNDLQQESDAPK